MRSVFPAFAALPLLTCVALGPAHAQKFFRCTDARGQTVYQQAACSPSGSASATAAAAPAAPATVRAAAAPASAAASAAPRTPRPCYSEREIESVRQTAASPNVGKADRERLEARARRMEACQR